MEDSAADDGAPVSIYKYTNKNSARKWESRRPRRRRHKGYEEGRVSRGLKGERVSRDSSNDS